MSKELIIKRCTKCGALVKVLKDCNCADCGITCCGESMKVMEPNTVDAAVEKHVPTYEVVNEKVVVKVNHVMEDEHYIEWISMVTDEKECMVKLQPGQNAECSFKYVPGSKLYAYCNKHGLWSQEVK